MNNIDTVVVDRVALINDLASMIRIPSINRFGEDDPLHPAEAAMANYFEQRLAELGLETSSRDISSGRRNVWGRLKGSGYGPVVLLAGHLDTVGVAGYNEPFEPKIEDGKIFGRGSCDMKAGLAAYLEVARVMVNSGKQLAGDLIIAGVVDEEHAMIGSQDFGINGPPVDYAIVAEPTGLAICPVHKGQICMTIKTYGHAAHSSMPDNGTNAIYHMAWILKALQNYAESLKQRAGDPMCGQPSFSVGVIRGGDNACSVPDLCEIDIDRRTIPGENYETVCTEIEEIIGDIEKENPAFRYELMPPTLNLPPLATPETSPLINALRDSSETVLGVSSPISAFPGSTDAPNFKCPAVICGAGNLVQCHSLNEFVSIDEVEAAVKIYCNAISAIQNS